MNLTEGGLMGYCSSKSMTSRKVPSSNGVSTGPIMTAFLTQGQWPTISVVSDSGRSPTMSCHYRGLERRSHQREDRSACAAVTRVSNRDDYHERTCLLP